VGGLREAARHDKRADGEIFVMVDGHKYWKFGIWGRLKV